MGRAGSGGSAKDHRYNNTAFPIMKDKGRAVNGPWYHPGSSRPCGTRPWLHGDRRFHAIAMHRLDNGSHLLRNGAPVAAYFTPIRSSTGSGRGSRVLFAGDPDPASQHTRFSFSFLPGTCPCHRRLAIRLLIPSCMAERKMSIGYIDPRITTLHQQRHLTSRHPEPAQAEPELCRGTS